MGDRGKTFQDSLREKIASIKDFLLSKNKDSPEFRIQQESKEHSSYSNTGGEYLSFRKVVLDLLWDLNDAFAFFGKETINALKKYAQFEGRSTVSEFWSFHLIVVPLVTVLTFFNWSIGVILFLFFFIPGLSLLVRRLHDQNRSSLKALLLLAPIFGLVILLIWATKRGTIGSNKYGPDPVNQ